MTAQNLPDNLNYCFCPAYDLGDEVQQIRIVVEGMSGFIPTALVALTLDDAQNICDRLNARLGLTRDDWTQLVAQSMNADPPAPGSPAVH